MDKGFVILVFVLVILFFAAILVPFNSANVVLNYEDQVNRGEGVAGNLIINIEKGDSLDINTPILIFLSQNNVSLFSKTITMGEFVNLSDNYIDAVNVNGGLFYQTPGVHKVEISKIMNYTFDKPENYDLLFAIPKIDLYRKDSIKVN